MRNKTNQVTVFIHRIESVKQWKSANKCAMTPKNIKRCAKALNLKTAVVKDILNSIKTRGRVENKAE